MTQRENGPIQDAYLLWRPAEVDGQPWYVLKYSRGSIALTSALQSPPCSYELNLYAGIVKLQVH